MNCQRARTIHAAFLLHDVAEELKLLEQVPDVALRKKIKKSFNRIVKTTVIFIVLYIPLIMAAIMMLMKYSPGCSDVAYTRAAHVRGDKVWYIQNDEIEINLSDFGFDPSKVKPDAKLIVLLDGNGELIDLVYKDDYFNNQYIWMGLVFLAVVVPIIILIVILVKGRKSLFKDWYDFKKWCKDTYDV